MAVLRENNIELSENTFRFHLKVFLEKHGGLFESMIARVGRENVLENLCVIYQELDPSNFGRIMASEWNVVNTLWPENYKKYKYFYVYSNSTIAYKGGHYEKDLLNSLSIPAVNLESFGCPKAEKLFDQIIWLKTHKNHLSTLSES